MQTRMRFVEDGARALTVLEIRAPLQHPLVVHIERRLKRLGVQVVHSDVRMQRAGVELTLHVSEFSGGPLSPRRRLELQTALLSQASPSETPPAPALRTNGPESGVVLSEEGRERESWPG
jgi:hypothetical protein